MWKVIQEEASLHSLQAFCVQALSAMRLMSSHQQRKSLMNQVKKAAAGVCRTAQRSAWQ